MALYFAYGSVLSKRHVGEWAGEHGVDARLFQRGAPATLRGYKLVFDVESRFWGGRVADLAEDKDGVVHGVLFEIPPLAMGAVQKKEGVPTGLSQEILVKVEADGKTVDAKAYIARPEKRVEPGAPSGRLMGYLVEGAKERGLPEEWIKTLEGFQAQAGAPQQVPGRVGITVDVKQS
ncbi:MAG: gamma-glutamylcyclotransferase [Deltaproteobacteria bacterium]|nr:gamma-glutamylcyclotransferase [Deltaproteobacteria bacterium]